MLLPDDRAHGSPRLVAFDLDIVNAEALHILERVVPTDVVAFAMQKLALVTGSGRSGFAERSATRSIESLDGSKTR
jgi:hypothetical protein